MHWTEEVIAGLDAATPQTINDSKTPSGRAHVGALRGVLIHDAVYKVAREKGHSVRYLFGCDDYDPVDEIPYGQREVFEVHLGKPLCMVPPPPGSAATDMADHFITEFWGVFKDLGVTCEFYRMRDVYRTGRFNEAIDRILRSADVVRKIYKEVSNSDRPANWFPFQTICENCGRVGTTEVTAYDGKEVTYECKPNLVEWARGCGHRGKMSPFDGKGKLPWKLEWVAKWATFPVTIEGAGEDHNTKGGSRDVAAHCLKAIYGREAPLNIPYGFVLVGGAKMSSSKGLGVSARQVADFLPPEALRFLMLRTKPRSQANFEPSQDALVKLFNELDRSQKKTFTDPKFSESDKRSYLLSEVTPEGEFFAAEFSLVIALVQMPHLDIDEQFEKIKGSPLSPIERAHLARRVHAARFWLEHFAQPEERLEIQKALPAGALELTVVQRGFLHALAQTIEGLSVWTGDALQTAVFDSARLTPIDQPAAFAALYRVLLNKAAGPKAGNLLAFLERDWVIRRLRELPLDRAELGRATAQSADDVARFIVDSKPPAARVTARRADGAVEFRISMQDDKTHLRRVLLAASAQDPSEVVREVSNSCGVQVSLA